MNQLVELLTGKEALLFDRPEEERNLATYFLSASRQDRSELLNDCIVNEANVKQVKEGSKLAKEVFDSKRKREANHEESGNGTLVLEGLRKVQVMHPWVHDGSNLQETEYFLGGISSENVSYGITMRNYNIPLPPGSGGR